VARITEDPGLWLSRISSAKAALERHIEKTDPYVRAYSGYFPTSLPGAFRKCETDDNRVYPFTRMVISNLLFRNPRILVPSRRPSDLSNAHIAAAVINRVIEESNVEPSFREAMQDAVLRGSGWLKTGYHTESAPLPGEDVVVNSADEDVHKENENLLMGMAVEAQEDENHDKHIAAHQALMTPEILAGVMQQFGEQGMLQIVAHIEQHRRFKKDVQKKGRLDWRVEPEQVWCRYVDPRDLILGPATRYEDVRWIAHRIVKPLRDVQADPAYENTSDLKAGAFAPHQFADRARTKGDDLNDIQQALLGSGKGNRTSRGSDPDEELVELFEVWDRRTETVLVVSPGSDKFLRKGPSPYAALPGFFPFVRIAFQTKPGHGMDPEAEAQRPYGYSLVEAWWQDQLDLNHCHSILKAIALHSLPQYIADSSVPSSAITKLTRGEPFTVVKLSAQTPEAVQKDPRLAISPLQFASASVDLHARVAALQQSIQFKSGFSEVQMGAAPTPRTSATGYSIMSASATASLEKMLDEVEGSFQHLAKIVRALVRQFFTTERVVHLTGPEGEEWVSYLGTDLYGDEVRVETKSSFAQNEMLKKHEALQLYNLLVQNPFAKQLELLTYVLREHGIPTPANFIASPEEIAQQQALLSKQEGGPQDVQQAQSSAPGPGDLETDALNAGQSSNTTL